MTSCLESTPKTPPAGWPGMWRAWRSQDVGTGVGAGFTLVELGDRRLLWALALLGLHVLGHAQSVSVDRPKQVEGVAGGETSTGRIETLAAIQPTSALTANPSNAVLQNVEIKFHPDATDLSEPQVRYLIESIATVGPLATSKWRVNVVVPKGFTEGRRQGFARAVAVRNALVAGGAPPAHIELRVHAGDPQTADNTRVSIRLAS